MKYREQPRRECKRMKDTLTNATSNYRYSYSTDYSNIKMTAGAVSHSRQYVVHIHIYTYAIYSSIRHKNVRGA